jgi:hypothetical protein
MAWKCPPLHLLNWNNKWKWRTEMNEHEELKAAVRSFFNDYLDQREESDSGRVFAPIAISNCRCMTLDPMSKLMTKMRELSGAKPPPKREE